MGGMEGSFEVVGNRSHGLKALQNVVLTDASTLEFRAPEVRDGRLIGVSPVYGRVTVPVGSIRRLRYNDYEADKYESMFRGWVAEEPREPELVEAE